MSADLDTETYRSTRAAWQRIWQAEGVLQQELQTLEYTRSVHARSLYLPYLPSGDLLLEAGCGVGIRLIELTRLGHRVVGVDYAENALEEFHAVFPDHRVAAADVNCLPFPDGRFGGYLSFGVFEHFEFGPGPALREAYRVLWPGGVLVLTLPYPDLVWRVARANRRLVLPRREAVPSFFETAYTPREVEREVYRAGFSVLAQHPIGHSFTLWGLSRVFRGPGYYETSPLAEKWGRRLRRLLPWAMCFETLTIAKKPSLSG